MSTTIKHVTGDRVHVLINSSAPSAPTSPSRPPSDPVRSGTSGGSSDWAPGAVMDAHILFGRVRYVVMLDDDRRMVASAFQIRTRPPIAWVDAAMSEALDLAS